MASELSQSALDTLFLSARTHRAWLPRAVEEDTLRQVHDLARMGPTSANCSPQRIVFVRSRQAKARLIPLLAEDNRGKSLAAPVTAIFGIDTRFFELMPRLFPHEDARAWFDAPGKETIAASTAFRNATLQAAYFMLAARAIGLDCGPMSGFDNEAVDREFFPGGRIRSNFLCNLGYGDPAQLKARGPRLAFDEVNRIE